MRRPLVAGVARGVCLRSHYELTRTSVCQLPRLQEDDMLVSLVQFHGAHSTASHARRPTLPQPLCHPRAPAAPDFGTSDPRWTDWSKWVPASMGGRTTAACRERWFNRLDPKLNRGDWSPEEDAPLIRAVELHGQHWAAVARAAAIPGRNDKACSLRWLQLRRAIGDRPIRDTNRPCHARQDRLELSPRATIVHADSDANP